MNILLSNSPCTSYLKSAVSAALLGAKGQGVMTSVLLSGAKELNKRLTYHQFLPAGVMQLNFCIVLLYILATYVCMLGENDQNSLCAFGHPIHDP